MPRPFPESIYVGAEFKMNCGSTFKVMEVNSSRDIKLKSLESGFEVAVSAIQITKLCVKDPYAPVVQGVGFIGEGIFSPTVKLPNGKSKKTPAYMKWAAMMERCYSDKLHLRHPSYAECEVCEEWQYFQCFAAWFYDNNPGEGYELDKDLIDRDNKVYSPEKCSFITREQNASIAKRKLRPVSITNGVVNISFDSVKSAGRFIESHSAEKSGAASIHGLITKKRKSVKGWVLA